MNSDFQIPHFIHPPKEYNQRHMAEFVRQLTLLIKELQANGQVQAATLNLTSLPTEYNSIATDVWSDDGVLRIGEMSSTEPAELIKIDLMNGGDPDMTVDGSSTPVTFKYTVPADKILYLHRVIIYMEDTTAFSAGVFGGTGGALANGVTIVVGGTTIDTWKTNADLELTFFDAEGRAVFAKETKSIGGRWTFTKDTGSPIKLIATETVSFVINDDLTGLDIFEAKIGGKLVDA